jgi:hypothetical protein
LQVAQCEDYQLPFYNAVPQDPSFEDMFQVHTYPMLFLTFLVVFVNPRKLSSDLPC